ncbi:FAD-dependent monooxygenase, partial [Candidatus Bathyarchaeota archaeon]|nr:FAD-dependent monooxygenase [Candidatus Bathyarchaeota archaeon]
MATSKSHFLEGKTIIIVGAGMAGLSFAIALRKQWDPTLTPPRIHIYERDTREAANGRHGYSLTLAGYDETGGLYALKQLGLLDDILPHAVSGLDGDTSFKLWNPDWSQILSVRYKPASGLPSAGIRVARRHLREVLVDGAEAGGGISWGRYCISARPLDNGRVSVVASFHGDDGPPREEECDFLVCADGSNSRLRACLRPDDKLQYLGAIQLGGSATFDKMPEQVGMNWGVTMSNGRGVALFSSPMDDQSLIWSLSCLEAEPRPPLDKTSSEQKQAVLDECRKLGEVFAEPFPSFVANTDLESVFSIPARDKQPFAHNTSLGAIAFI